MRYYQNLLKNMRNSFFLFLIILASCKQDEIPKENYIPTKEEFIEINKGWTDEENQIIENYIRRRNWKMITTGTGIRYMIYKHADTLLNKAVEGDIAFVNYEIRLLEGDSLCYSSEGEPSAFRVGMDHVETGLHEVITYFRVGDHAKIIMPYHRAFGLIGDFDQIPPQAALVYDIEVVDIKKEE